MNMKISITDLEDKLYDSANQLRDNLSAEEYMNVVLSIITLKYISDKYDRTYDQLLKDGYNKNDIDDDLLRANDSFLLPKKAHWNRILTFVGLDNIGEEIDNAIIEIKKINPWVKQSLF